MAKETQTIRINSINGGMSLYDFAADDDQFYDALGVDIESNSASNTGRAAGPSTISVNKPRSITSTALTGVPLWMQGEPKSGGLFVYDANGSVYTLGVGVTGVGDLNDGGTARGNGMAYYDNYMYFARDTTVARYGPLNGTSSFTDDYWVGVLGKTALGNQSYPARDTGYTDARLPNHVLHRHLGKLYIADVVNNQGYIHYIQTTKTTVEGDTDNGSTYQKLDLPYGYYPTDITSFGDHLVIAAFEAYENTSSTYNSASSYEGRAALFFWDTVSDNYYKVIQNEFPDQIITALENANGVLYTFSSNISYEPTGVRICRYLGGESFEQITFLTDVDTPFPGGTISRLNQILFASVNQQDSSRACVWSIGSQSQPLSNAVFNVAGARKSTGAGHALCLDDGGAPWSTEVFYSYANSNSSATIEGFGGNESNWDTDLISSTQGNAYWKSNWITPGTRFKITKVKLFPASASAGVDLRVYLAKDNKTTETLIGTVDDTSYPTPRGSIILKPNGYMGNHSFQLIFRWFGTNDIDIRLPIEIEYELYGDD